jgi:hypothetical protein
VWLGHRVNAGRINDRRVRHAHIVASNRMR